MAADGLDAVCAPRINSQARGNTCCSSTDLGVKLLHCSLKSRPFKEGAIEFPPSMVRKPCFPSVFSTFNTRLYRLDRTTPIQLVSSPALPARNLHTSIASTSKSSRRLNRPSCVPTNSLPYLKVSQRVRGLSHAKMYDETYTINTKSEQSNS